MDVVLFGYGKMGKNIYRSLKKNADIQNFYVVDPVFTDEQVVPLQFKSFDDIPSGVRLDAAFIASNSVTHFDVLKKTIGAGIQNIFCEKPMCLTQREYQIINKKLSPDARFVVDYILRSSQALPAFQSAYNHLLKDGYQLMSCNIDYGKDKRQDPRRFKDIGVYEELYHVWDLCFNGPLFGDIKDIRVLQNTYIPDPEIKGRCIQQRFKYRIQGDNGKSFILNLNSSFQKDRQERSFICFFKKGEDQQILSLVFDKAKQDKCILVSQDNQIKDQTFPSDTKLDTIINDSISYFQTGKKASYFHDASDSAKFHDLMVTLKQIGPLHQSSIRNRILESTR